MQLCAFKTLIYNGKIIVTIEGDIIVQYLFFLCLGFYLLPWLFCPTFSYCTCVSFINRNKTNLIFHFKKAHLLIQQFTVPCLVYSETTSLLLLLFDPK